MPNEKTHTVVMTSEQYESFQCMLENEERVTEEMNDEIGNNFKRIWNIPIDDEESQD